MSAAASLVALLLVGSAVAGRPRRPARPVGATPHWNDRNAMPTGTTGAPPRSARTADADALRGLPELVDLLAVAVAAGLPAAAATLAVARRAPDAWRPALHAVELAVERGARLTDALGRLVDHHGDLARPLIAALRAALDDGDSLGPALTRLAADARDLRRRRAEEAARRLPVRLLLPLVTCSLPAFAVLTVVPVLAGALTGLRLPR